MGAGYTHGQIPFNHVPPSKLGSDGKGSNPCLQSNDRERTAFLTQQLSSAHNLAPMNHRMDASTLAHVINMRGVPHHGSEQQLWRSALETLRVRRELLGEIL
jgi:hypothetical protein